MPAWHGQGLVMCLLNECHLQGRHTVLSADHKQGPFQTPPEPPPCHGHDHPVSPGRHVQMGSQKPGEGQGPS